MNKKLHSLLLLIALANTPISTLAKEEATNKQTKEIKEFKISPKAATQWTGALCTVIAAFGMLSNPIISLPVLVGGVYTVANPEKVINAVEKTVETVKSEEKLESTTKKIGNKIKAFFTNLFTD